MIGRRSAQLRRQRQDPGGDRRAAPVGAAVRVRHRCAARQRAVALPPDLGHARALRAEARPLWQGLQRRGDRARRSTLRGCATAAWPRTSCIARVARDLADGKIVGWFQGRFEMGPRALGNRSILADPRRADMRDVLNAKVKQRESFRPFAPAVLVERAARVLRDRPARSVHDAGAARAPGEPRPHPGRRARGRHRPHPDGRALESNPRYYGLIEEFGRLDRRSDSAQHQLQPHRAHRRLTRDAVECYLQHAAWMCWCSAISTPTTAARARRSARPIAPSPRRHAMPPWRTRHGQRRADRAAPRPRVR